MKRENKIIVGLVITLFGSSVLNKKLNVHSKSSKKTEFVAGKNYTVIGKPVETETGNKVEVRELSWYFCPHCFSVQPLLNNWLKTMNSSAQFVRQPAVFPGWEYGANFYYVLEELGELERLHGALFDAIHRQKLKFSNQQDFVTWLTLNGVDEEKANKVYNSFPVKG